MNIGRLAGRLLQKSTSKWCWLGGSEGHEKWSNSGYILKVKETEFATTGMGGGKKRSRLRLQGFCLMH